MKVSKKTYRDKQNQAMGPLIVAGLFFTLFCFRAYRVLFQGADFEWDILLWAIAIPILLVTWRIRERKLKELEVDE